MPLLGVQDILKTCDPQPPRAKREWNTCQWLPYIYRGVHYKVSMVDYINVSDNETTQDYSDSEGQNTIQAVQGRTDFLHPAFILLQKPNNCLTV